MGIISTLVGSEPVSLAEAKAHCRIDLDDDDILISTLIMVAREYCETVTGRALPVQTIEYTFDRWPSGMLYLPRPPVTEILAFQYLPENETVYTDLVDGTDYYVDFDSNLARLTPVTFWPTAVLHPIAGIKVQYTAGYDTVPESYKAAIKLIVGSFYENREGVLPAGHIGRELPMGVMSLLWQDRVFWTEDFNK